MSLVQYVLHGSATGLGPATWVELANRLKEEGYAVHLQRDDGWKKLSPSTVPAPDQRSLMFSAGTRARQAKILLNFETRDSNGYFAQGVEWSPAARALLLQRPQSLFLQAVYEGEEPLEFWNAFALTLAQILDGLVFDESSGRLTLPKGPTFAPGLPDEAIEDSPDESPELPLEAIRGLGTVVLECHMPFTPARLLALALAQCEDVELMGSHRQDAASWSRIRVWDPVSTGLRLDLDRVGPARKYPAYVRATFDLEEGLFSREPSTVQRVAHLARKLFGAMRSELEVKLVDFEPAVEPGSQGF